VRFWRRRTDKPALKVSARVVEGLSPPPETRVTGVLRDVRFAPETPNVLLDHVTAERVDFSGLRFWAFQTDECRFVDCNFSRVDVEWLPFANGGSVFERCCFERSRIGDFGDVRLERCEFVNANLNGWFTWQADIVECRFAGRLRGVVFRGTDVDGQDRNEFRGNDFGDADIDDVAFRGGIVLDVQLLPTGEEYVRLRDLKARVTRARRELGHWQDVAEREAALKMLDVVADVFTEEPDVFTKRAFIVEMADDDEQLGRSVLELLERV
jgi:hypothetical protein